jgi:hypothetical protein
MFLSSGLRHRLAAQLSTSLRKNLSHSAFNFKERIPLDWFVLRISKILKVCVGVGVLATKLIIYYYLIVASVVTEIHLAVGKYE